MKKKAVTGKKIAPSAVTSDKVKDSSLLAKDFEAGQLPAGRQGMKGDQGEPGPLPAILPSGKTLTGVFGLGGHGEENGGVEASYGEISFAYPLPSAPAAKVVEFGSASAPPECPGTSGEPVAAPGWLCVYENREQNERIDVFSYPQVFAPGSGAGPSASRYGAMLNAQGSAAGTHWLTTRKGPGP